MWMGGSGHGRTNFACLDCRHATSRARWDTAPSCPTCRKPMEHMGANFKVPRKAAKSQWEKVRRLIAANRRFTPHCGCCKPWVPVKTLSDAKSELGQRRADRKVWA